MMPLPTQNAAPAYPRYSLSSPYWILLPMQSAHAHPSHCYKPIAYLQATTDWLMVMHIWPCFFGVPLVVLLKRFSQYPLSQKSGATSIGQLLVLFISNVITDYHPEDSPLSSEVYNS